MIETVETDVLILGIGAALASVAVPGGRTYNLAWQDWLNLESQVTVARLIVAVRVRRGASGLAVRREPVALIRATLDGSAAAPALIEIGD